MTTDGIAGVELGDQLPLPGFRFAGVTYGECTIAYSVGKYTYFKRGGGVSIVCMSDRRLYGIEMFTQNYLPWLTLVMLSLRFGPRHSSTNS